MVAVVIVAGGKGTRLQSVIGDNPKVLAEFAGSSNFERIVKLAAEYGCEDFHVLAGYRAELIQDAAADLAARYDVDVDVHIEKEPLGTAGCFHLLRGKLNGPALIIYGDVLCDFDVKALVDAHCSHSHQATIVVQPTSHMFDSDLISVANDASIEAIHSKPHADVNAMNNLASAAVYVLDSELISTVPGEPTDWFQDFFPDFLRRGKGIVTHKSWEYFHDFGTPERFEKAIIDVDADIVGHRRKRGLTVQPTVVDVGSEKDHDKIISRVRQSNYERIPVLLFGDDGSNWTQRLNAADVYVDYFIDEEFSPDRLATFCQQNGLYT